MSLTPTNANMQQHPEAFMTVMHRIQRFYDAHPGLSGVRSFSLVPHTDGFGHKYITIDTTGLRALMASFDPATPSEKTVLVNKDLYWRKLFRVAKVDSASKQVDENGRDGQRSFAHCIMTDGKAVSIVMKRPKSLKTIEKELRPDDFDLVWGLDPGVRDVFRATNSEGATAKCSTGEFYSDAKYNRSRRKLEKWKLMEPRISAIETWIPGGKTTKIDRLETHIEYVADVEDILTEFYGRQRVRNLKFSRYCACKKKLHKLCKSLSQYGKRTLVGFGDWSVDSAKGIVKGHRFGPSNRLKHELKRYATVVEIDEHLTSQVCNCCKRRSLENMRIRKRGEDGRWTSQKSHSVLHCRSNVCLNKTVNRDDNASRNILELTFAMLTKLDRPACFSRECGCIPKVPSV